MMASDLQPSPMQKLTVSKHFIPREYEVAVERQRSTTCLRLIISALFGVLVPVSVLAAQQARPQPKENAAQDSGVVLRQTVRRVRVDVVVTDATGQPVTGLRAADFHIAEDGKPQSIRQFEYHSEENAEPALPKRPLLPPHSFMNLPTAPEHGPLTVLLYDALNTPLADQLNARAQMLEFLKKSAGRRIAIFYLGDRLRVLQGFTSDTDSIERAISDPATMPQRSHVSYSQPSGAEDMDKLLNGTGADTVVKEMQGKLKEMEATEASARMDLRVDMTLDALMQIGRFLAGTPGRKNLIWYSGSFPAQILMVPPTPQQQNDPEVFFRTARKVRDYDDRIKAATSLLNSDEVAVYPIDARGLQVDFKFEQWAAEITTLDQIGEQTGGRAFYNTNGLEQALETAADDGGSYYSLLYAPTNMKFDGSVRRISVRLGHGHHNLAYRRSYFASDLDTGVIPQAAADEGNALAESMAAASQFGAPPAHQLVFAVRVDAVGAPAPATAEQMSALVPYEQQAAKAEHRKFVPPAKPVSMQQYAIQYGVLAKQLDLHISANGVYHSDLSIAALAFDQDGATLWGTQTQLEDAIPSTRIGEFRKDSFHAIQTVFVPVDTAVIRLVVRDEHSGRIGSIEIRLPLAPDQKQTSAP